jgi:WD40 repeat protein
MSSPLRLRVARVLGSTALAAAVLGSAGSACTPAAPPHQPPPASTQITPAAPPSLELTHRFGSLRFRHGESIRRTVFLGAPRMLASIGQDAVRVWSGEGDPITAILGRAADIAALPGTATLVVAETRAVAAFQIEPSGAKPLWRSELSEDVVPLGLQASADMIRVVVQGRVLDLDPRTGEEILSHGPFPWLKKPRLATVAPNGSGVIVRDDAGTTFYPLAPRGGSPASGPVKLASSSVTSIAVSPDSTFALATIGGVKNLIQAWDLPSGEPRWTVEAGYPNPPAVGISRDGSRVTTVSKDGIALRDARTGSVLRTLGPAVGSFDPDDPTAPVFESGDSSVAAFSPDDKQLVWGTGNTLRFWDLEKGTESLNTDLLSYRLQALSPAGDRAVMSGVVWDLDRKQRIFDVRKASPEDPFVLGAAFTGASSSLMAFRLGTVELWDIDKKKRIRRVEHPGSVSAGVAFAEHALFVVDYSVGLVTIVREQDRQKPWKEIDRNGKYSSSDDSYFPDPAAGKTRFALPLRDGVELFDARTGESVAKLLTNTGPRAVACSEDGKSLAAAMPDVIELWDPEARAPVHSFEVESPTSITFLPGTPLLFYGLTNGSIGIYDTARRAAVALLPAAHPGRVRELRAAPGRLLSSGTEGTVAVWQIKR